MKRKILLYLFLLFSVTTFATSKKNYFSGYYINLRGDTVQCQIKFNDWINTPEKIEILENNIPKVFGAEDIRGFGVENYGDYQSAKVNFHIGPISGIKYPTEYSDSTVTRVCFLKRLDQGNYTLYQFSLPQRDYFFLSYPDHPYTELIYRVKEKNDTLSEDLAYKNLLNDLLTWEGLRDKYESRLLHATYSKSDMFFLVSALNKHQGVVKTNTKMAGSDFVIDVFAGCIRNSFPTSFDGDFSTDNQFKSGYSPTGGVNLLYSLPGFFRSFKVGLAIGYNQYHVSINNNTSYSKTPSPYYSYTVTYTENFSMSNSMIFGSAYFAYEITPLKKFQFYIKAGVNSNFSISSDINSHIQNYGITSGIRNGDVPFSDTASRSGISRKIANVFFSPVFGFGCLKGFSKIEFTYTPPVNMAYPNTPVFKYQTMALCYYYTLWDSKKRR